jgi:shikimate dehydrogenase
VKAVLCYLIGYPVGHSMSAMMQNAAFRETGLDFNYELLEVKPKELEKTVTGKLTGTQVRGANVTIPHKVAIMQYLDEIDFEASRIGAVNVVVNDEGTLKGYNTDGGAALRTLAEAYGSLSDARIVVLGAGGAAKAISYKLAENASELMILNRTLEHAVTLSHYLSSLPECRADVKADSLQYESLRNALRGADILVNTTPVGMHPKIESSPVEPSLLKPDLLVLDAVYNPLKTKLLQDAEEAGARVLTGVNMLVYQGTATFELWTGRKAPETVMMRAVMEALQGREN